MNFTIVIEKFIFKLIREKYTLPIIQKDLYRELAFREKSSEKNPLEKPHISHCVNRDTFQLCTLSDRPAL